MPSWHQTIQEGWQEAPVSMGTVVLWHLVFLHQWNRRCHPRRQCVNYRILIEQKRFYRLWLALVSHPTPTTSLSEQWCCGASRRGDDNHNTATANATQSPPLSTASLSSSSSLLVEMGDIDHPNDANIPGSSVYRLLDRLVSLLRQVGTRSDQCISQAGLGAAPLLLYNAHIVWSCRALEVEFMLGDQHYYWNYARILVCWGAAAYGLELALYDYLLRHLRLPPSFRDRLRHRPLSTPTAVSAVLLGVFHWQYYPAVPPSILPWVPNPPFVSASWAYMLSLAILSVLSHASHPLTSVLAGGIVGGLWSLTGGLGFKQPYWNGPACVGLLVWTLLAARVHVWRSSGEASCPLVVACNRRGQVLVPLYNNTPHSNSHVNQIDDDQSWVPLSSVMPSLEGHRSNDTEDDSNHSDDDSSSSSSDEVADAFPSPDDDEIYGRRLPEDDDLEAAAYRRETEMVPLVSAHRGAATSRMRSRRR